MGIGKPAAWPAGQRLTGLWTCIASHTQAADPALLACLPGNKLENIETITGITHCSAMEAVQQRTE